MLKIAISMSFFIISLNNYPAGIKKNYFKNKKIKYLKSKIKNISKILEYNKNKNHIIFH